LYPTVFSRPPVPMATAKLTGVPAFAKHDIKIPVSQRDPDDSDLVPVPEPTPSVPKPTPAHTTLTDKK